jgi:MraZ protein
MQSVPQQRFIGTFRHSIDAKGRLTVPAKWRFSGDEEDVYLAIPNVAGFITVLPPERTAQLQAKLDAIKLTDVQGQQALSAFIAMMHSFGCDKQGRINLSKELMAHAGLAKDAVLAGSLSAFNIYSPELFASLAPQDPSSQLQALSRFDL